MGRQTALAASWGTARPRCSIWVLPLHLEGGRGPLGPQAGFTLYASPTPGPDASPPPPQPTTGISLLTTTALWEWREFIRLAGPAPGPGGPWRLQLLQVQIHFLQICRTAAEGRALALLQNALFSLLSRKYLSMLIQCRSQLSSAWGIVLL